MLKQKIKVEPNLLEEKLEKNLGKLWKKAKREFKIIKKWLFFYQPENKMDAMLHIFDIFVVIYIAIRLANG